MPRLIHLAVICLLSVSLSSLPTPCLAEERIPVSGRPLRLLVGDWNGDGLDDLVVGHENLSIFPGTPAGSLGPETIVPLPEVSWVYNLAAGDINKDGFLDLLVATRDDPGLLLGNGDGTFQTPSFFGFDDLDKSRDVAVGDLNEDGNLDVVTADVEKVAVYFGEGDGTFDTCLTCQPPRRLLVPDSALAVAISDLNVDGKLDLVIAERSHVGIFLGRGDGTFDSESSYPAGYWPFQIIIGDFNSDEILDILAMNIIDSASLFLGTGHGSFRPEIVFGRMWPADQYTAVTDLDLDGDLDLAVPVYEVNELYIHLNRGNGFFDEHPNRPDTGMIPIAAVATDLNFDGMPDIIVGNSESQDLSIFSNSELFLGYCPDGDGDGFGFPGDPTCPNGTPFDCDDTDSTVNPLGTEISDGIDNNCNDLVDEIVVVGACEVNPSSLNLQSQGNTLSMKVTLSDVTAGESLDPALMSPAYISRISAVGTGDIVLPVPRTESGCKNFIDDGIWETYQDRTVTGGGVGTLRFNLPSDGSCETMDGNRQDIIALMLDIPDGELASLCITSTYPGAPDPFECCGPVTVTNHGNR